MAIDPRKRQKNLERRKAKQKAERREVARREAGGLPARLTQASAAPILHCCATDAIQYDGLAQVLVSRQLNNGSVAFALFLVDTYCLGVKNTFANVIPRSRYEREIYAFRTSGHEFLPLKPECARRFVERAVEYALDLGISPHPDYRITKLIFGEIQAEACTQDYEFGREGKPFFVAGPHDSAARCQEILLALETRCGRDGYHFTMPLGGLSGCAVLSAPSGPGDEPWSE